MGPLPGCAKSHALDYSRKEIGAIRAIKLSCLYATFLESCVRSRKDTDRVFQVFQATLFLCEQPVARVLPGFPMGSPFGVYCFARKQESSSKSSIFMTILLQFRMSSVYQSPAAQRSTYEISITILPKCCAPSIRRSAAGASANANVSPITGFSFDSLIARFIATKSAREPT